MLLFPLTARPATPSDNPDLLFSASYNSQSEKAESAGGKPESTTFKRTLQYLDAAIPGVVKIGFQTLDNEKCQYEMMGNFDPREGGLGIWVRPENWSPSDQRANVFFAAEIPGKYRMLLWKPAKEAAVVFQISTPGAGAVTREVRCPAANWKPKEWHRLDAAWGGVPLKLYVDGTLAAAEAKDQCPADGGRHLPAPEAAGWISVNPNHFFADDPACVATDRTTIDEVRIWKKAPEAAAIQKAYAEAMKQLMGGVYRKPLVTIPLTKNAIEVDGKLGEAEWADAARVPIRCLRALPQASDRLAEAYLKYDRENLYLGFHSRVAP